MFDGRDAENLGAFLVEAQPVLVRTVFELGSTRPVALTLNAEGPTGLLSARAVTEVLEVVRSQFGPPTSPMLFTVDPDQLGELPDAGFYSDHPMVVLIDADLVLVEPVRLLNQIRAARGQNWEIGLERVGCSYRSIRAATLVEPSLIGLAPNLLTPGDVPLTAEAAHAVEALVRDSGATVLVEAADETTLRNGAFTFGATLTHSAPFTAGQTHLAPALDYTLDLFSPPPDPDPARGVFELACHRYRPRQSLKPALVEMSKQIENLARTAGRSVTIFAAFQDPWNITADVRRRYRRLREDNETAGPLVIMAAYNWTEKLPGALTIDLERDDPLADEWVLAVLGPNTSALLTAVDHPHPFRSRAHRPSTHDRDRNFDYVLSFDRDLTAQAVRTALLRL